MVSSRYTMKLGLRQCELHSSRLYDTLLSDSATVGGGFSNLLVPIQIRVAEMALPRLSAISFMLLPPSIPILLSSALVQVGVLGGPSTRQSAPVWRWLVQDELT